MVKMVPILLILIYSSKSFAFGYDAGSDQAACGKPVRTSREYRPPCDLSRENYCATAGTTYPWHAVRRFVRENQGLMKRMYGDQRHIAVLQAELENNHEETNENNRQHSPDYEIITRNDLYRNEDKEENLPRLLHDDPKLGEILNAKFVYSEQASFKTKLNMPHFRPMTTQKTVEVNLKTEKLNASTEINTSTLAFENTTESIGTTKEDGVTENTTERIVVEESTTEYLTSTERVTEEMTTEAAEKKETVGEVLFQDMEEPTKKNQMPINFKLKGVNACPVKEEVVAPYWANNTRGEVLALLNLYPFEQYVHSEKCTFEHRQMYCREGCRCEQQYRLHRLLAYDPNNECRGIFSDWFRFPSCCVCKCYNIPPDFRVTSRSPRNKDSENDINDVPNWFLGKNPTVHDGE